MTPINTTANVYSTGPDGDIVSIETSVFSGEAGDRRFYRVFFYPDGSHMAQQRVRANNGTFVWRKCKHGQAVPADLFVSAYEAARQAALQA